METLTTEQIAQNYTAALDSVTVITELMALDTRDANRILLGVDGDINHWLTTSSRVATCVIIDRSGEIYQCFSSRYWGHHLGVKIKTFREEGVPLKTRQKSNGTGAYYANNEILNQESIGVQIDSWGWLEKKGDKFFSYTGREVAVENVQEYETPYRGYKYYEKYTKEQIAALKTLCLYWKATYGISMKYNADMWDMSTDAMKGKNAIWSHTSVRPDKSDVHPQPELIKMIKALPVK